MNYSISEKKNSLMRTIFVKIITIFFIVMCYFYISEAAGSISSLIIASNEYMITFGVSLLVFTFFSTIAGPITSLIAGFIAELLYQLAFYQAIYLGWCLIIGFYGLLCGIYKYKPLKYTEKKNVLFSMLILFLASLIAMYGIIIFQYFPNASIDFGIISLTYGLKFLTQALISSIFIVPFLLLIYDRLLAIEKRDLYFLLLTHHPVSASDHTFYFQFGRTKVHFCSRCSGIVIGGISAIFFSYVFNSIFQVQVSGELALFIIIIFPIPGLVDWGTQKLLLHTSTTSSRLFTGFIIGVALHFLTFTYDYYIFTMIIISVYFGILFLLMYIGHKREMRKFSEELDQLKTELPP